MTRKPGISLKLSAMVTVVIVAEMVLLAVLLRSLEPHSHNVLILVFVLGALLVGLGMAATLDWLVTRPLLRLVGQVRELPARGYATPILPSGIDEPRELGEALEAMRQLVGAREDELKSLNQELEARVEARTAELRAAQESLLQAEKLASVGELAGGVAHEVNNPTGVILARASYLVGVADDENLDPDLIEDLEVIVHQAERISRITGDLLSFARQSGTDHELVDLVEVSQLACNLLKHAAQATDVTLELETDTEVLVYGRRDPLEQVVFNLLKNGVEAVDPGGCVKLHVSSQSGEVRITVDDDGPGVPEQIRQRVFDPFFTTKPTGKGTGLGLAVAYGIVADHGGTITVEAAPGGGARFRVGLPCSPRGEEAIGA